MTKRVTIYLDKEIVKFHQKRAIDLEYNSFSKYMRDLLKASYDFS